MVDFPPNQLQKPEQTVLALREASKHADIRLFFKSAGLTDTDELETLRHIVNQSNKLLQSSLETDANQARVCNERQQIANTMLMALVDTPPTQSSDDADKRSCSTEEAPTHFSASHPCDNSHQKESHKTLLADFLGPQGFCGEEK